MPTGRLRVRRRPGYRPVYQAIRAIFGNDEALPIFEVILQSSLLPTIAGGSATPTFTRATVKQSWGYGPSAVLGVDDPVLLTCASGEAAFVGARRISEGVWSSVDANGVALTTTNGASALYGDAYGPFGYFAEGAGTQLVTPTASIRDMTQAEWVAGATMTVAKTGTGIDGVANSCSRLTGGAVGATNTAFQTLTAAASSRTYSVWLKRVTGTGTINITQDGGVGYTDVTSQINSTTFTRVSLTASVLNASFGINIDTDGDVILADFNQFEAGAFATSPMAAAGAARNADVLTYPLAGNFNTSQGSAYAEVMSVTTTESVYLHDSANATYQLATNPDNHAYDGTSNAISSGAGISAGVLSKIATSWGSAGMSCVWAGNAAGTSSFDGTMNMTSIGVGAGYIASYSKTIRNLRLYSRALTDAQLQQITS